MTALNREVNEQNGFESRWELIRQIQKASGKFYFIGFGLVILLIGIYIGFYIVDMKIIEDDFRIGLYTEVISILITIFVLDQVNEYRDKQRLKSRLRGEASSRSNVTAVSAIDWIRREGWLEGENSLLQNEDLSFANLQNADLRYANLQQAQLGFANLQEANLYNINLNQAYLRYANLQKADLGYAQLQQVNLDDTNLQEANLIRARLQQAVLVGAELQRANLNYANLQEVDLRYAKLQGSKMWIVNLQGANLINTNLEGAYIWQANLQDVVWADGNKAAILPDGTTWTPETDLERFTNHKNPEFDNTLSKIDNIRAEMGINSNKS